MSREFMPAGRLRKTFLNSGLIDLTTIKCYNNNNVKLAVRLFKYSDYIR